MDQFADLVKELKRRSKFQSTPVPFEDDDYNAMIIFGIRSLYVDLGYSDDYELDFDEENLSFNTSISVAKQEYIVNAAMLDFYQLIQQNVNIIVGYSTDSLTVTNADKPYANISNEIDKLHTRQIELFEKILADEEEG